MTGLLSTNVRELATGLKMAQRTAQLSELRHTPLATKVETSRQMFIRAWHDFQDVRNLPPELLSTKATIARIAYETGWMSRAMQHDYELPDTIRNQPQTGQVWQELTATVTHPAFTESWDVVAKRALVVDGNALAASCVKAGDELAAAYLSGAPGKSLPMMLGVEAVADVAQQIASSVQTQLVRSSATEGFTVRADELARVPLERTMIERNLQLRERGGFAHLADEELVVEVGPGEPATQAAIDVARLLSVRQRQELVVRGPGATAVGMRLAQPARGIAAAAPTISPPSGISL